ncbi:MAG: hypothetical protein JJ891_03760 [Rhizobiaceae bacterium]|jgi:hypothetical protein|nr:hypothetical protein [Rhizobiaceae bacterium]
MKDLLHRTFLAHPNSVEESYFQHFRFAMNFSGTLFVAACAALIHALVPALCERTASSRINELHRRMHNR